MSVFPAKKSLFELFKYGLVGITHNATGYLLYIGVTSLGADPVLTVACLYPIGAAVSFWLNKHWTFKQPDNNKGEVIRYVLSLTIGYLLNLSLLHVLVDRLGYPHRIIQLILILFIAVFLFLMFKFFVLLRKKNDNV